MAAREDEAEPVVGDRTHVVLRRPGANRRQLGLDLRLALEQLALLGQPAPAANPVDGAVARRRRDPRTGVVRKAARRPRLERDDEGLLDGLLGQVEVAGDTDERRDRPPRLLAEQAVDDLGREDLARRTRQALTAPATSPAPADEKSMTGRTSIEAPYFSPGQAAPSSRASSRSRASTR
jgi:hypothetical protein